MYGPFGFRGIDLPIVCAVLIVLVALMTLGLASSAPAGDGYPGAPLPGGSERFAPEGSYDAPQRGPVHEPAISLPLRPTRL